MKHILTGAVAITILLAGCKKDHSTPSGGNSGGPPPSGGLTGKITITAVSPQTPHPDNVITITGTGFNPDKTKEVVYFGNYDTAKKTFRGYVDGIGKDNISIITSASATQLVIQAYNTEGLNLDYSQQGYNYGTVMPGIQVIANGDTAYKVIVFKEMVGIRTIIDPQQLQQTTPTGWPGDSLFITCNGPVDKTEQLTVNGVAIPIIQALLTTYSRTHSTELHVFLPKELFGVSNNDTAKQNATVKLDLGDGTTEQSDFGFFISPKMSISSMAAAQSVYSLVALNNSGGVINVNVTGRNLKSDATVQFSSVTGGGTIVLNTTALDVSNFQDTITLPFSSIGLTAGTYKVSILRKDITSGNNIQYGAASFILQP